MPESVEQVIVNVTVFLVIAVLVVFGRWLRQTKRTLDDAHSMLSEVNHAVNCRPKGDPTLYELAAEGKVAAAEAKQVAATAVAQLNKHSRDDEVNFADLRARFAAMSDDVTANRLRNEAQDAAAADDT